MNPRQRYAYSLVLCQTSLSTLTLLTPEVWQNIPPPLIHAITVLTSHLTSLTLSHLSLDSALKTNHDNLVNRIKKTNLSLSSQVDVILATQKRHSHDLENISKKLEITTETLKNDRNSDKKDSEGFKINTNREIEAISGRINAFNTEIIQKITEIQEKIGNLKPVIRSEIEETVVKPEIRNINEIFEEFAANCKKNDKFVRGKIEEIEDFHANSLQNKLNLYEKSLENVTNLMQKSQKSREITREKVDSMIKNALQPLNAFLEEIKVKMTTEKGAEMTEIRNLIEKEMREMRGKVEEMSKEGERRVGSVEVSLGQRIEKGQGEVREWVSEVERSVLSEQFSVVTGLEQRLGKYMEDYVELQVREIRDKLSVPTT